MYATLKKEKNLFLHHYLNELLIIFLTYLKQIIEKVDLTVKINEAFKIIL